MDRERLIKTARGYWESRAILTGVELGVFPAIGRRRLSAASVAKRTGAAPRATGLLLDALAGQGVLEKKGASYAIAPDLVPVLTEGPGSALSMLRHHADLWASWSRLTETVRTGKAHRKQSAFERGPEEAEAFTKAMRDGAMRFAPGVAEEVDLTGRRCLLDLGGGPGIYATAFARRYPDLTVVIVELGNVATAGRPILAQFEDVKGRVHYHSADIRKDRLPAGADAVFLSHVIHGQSETENRALFSRVADALPRGGLFVVRDFFLTPDGTRPPSASIFTLNMLVCTPGGRSYTAQETSAWLREAGFRSARRLASEVAPDASYILARK